jgi:prepilin-type N-terminal cleavage/methylation domain-containing protein
MQTVCLNKKGLTLIEVMIALVVTLVVFLALMQTALVGIDSNTKNLLRDEAVRIADQRMSEIRNRPFSDLDLNGAADPNSLTITQTINRNFRNISNVAFDTVATIDTLNPENKQINITVSWTWKGETYNHSITTVLKA